MSAPRVLVVDHKDSFVFILAEQFLSLGAELETYRGDIALADLEARVDAFDPDLVVLSPGPGHPAEAATTLAWLERAVDTPVLGVCLGHQAIGLVAGATVERGPRPVHGSACSLRVVDDPLFDGLPEPFRAARYHSLVVRDLPDTLRVIAVTDDAGGEEIVMAMRHAERPWIGLQFHPESFLTPGGQALLARTLGEACARRNRTVEIGGWQTSRS